jgi:hypothetical protein
MGPRVLKLCTVLLLAASVSQAAEVGWPDAVSRLASERYKAETCVALLKKHGTPAQIDRGRLTYAGAKADNDAVVAGLTTTLALDQKPVSLATLETKLQSSTLALAEFCKAVSDLVPPDPGQKSVVADIVKGAIEPLLTSLSEGVGALFRSRQEKDALIRGTIKTQLEAAQWPDFAEVKPAQ